jgi:hypothetical protein
MTRSIRFPLSAVASQQLVPNRHFSIAVLAQKDIESDDETRVLCDSVTGRGLHFHQALDLRRFVGVNSAASLVGVKECG